MSEIRLNLYDPGFVGVSGPYPGHDMLVHHGGAWMFAQWRSCDDIQPYEGDDAAGWWMVHVPNGSAVDIDTWPQGCVFYKWVHEDGPDPGPRRKCYQCCGHGIVAGEGEYTVEACPAMCNNGWIGADAHDPSAHRRSEIMRGDHVVE